MIDFEHLRRTIIPHLSRFSLAPRCLFFFFFAEKDLNRTSPPEICEWGAVEDLSIPQRFCTLAAIKMYHMEETKPTMLESSLHNDSKLVPYRVCYRRKLDKMSTLTNAIFCPPSTVQTSENERVHLDGFFLGKGDEDFNSVFTFALADRLGSRVNVLFYINSLMHSDVLKISEEESSNASRNKSIGLRIFKSEEAAWRFLSGDYLLRYVFGQVQPKSSGEGVDIFDAKPK